MLALKYLPVPRNKENDFVARSSGALNPNQVKKKGGFHAIVQNVITVSVSDCFIMSC